LFAGTCAELLAILMWQTSRKNGARAERWAKSKTAEALQIHIAAYLHATRRDTPMDAERVRVPVPGSAKRISNAG